MSMDRAGTRMRIEYLILDLEWQHWTLRKTVHFPEETMNIHKNSLVSW